MEKINATLMIEILGKPEDNVKEAIRTMITRLGAEKGVTLINKTYHDPKKIEDSDLFTTFAEADVEFESLANYFGTIFAYMPSHIEVTSPDKITISNGDLNELGGALAQRLHNYEVVTKKSVGDRDFLLEKLKEVAPDVFKKLTTPPEETKEDSSQQKQTSS